MKHANHCRECATRRMCLGAGLDDEALDKLTAATDASEPMHRGDYLYRAGEAASGCYVVRSGAYKTVVNDGHGGEHVTGFHFPGEILALGGQADGRHSDSAVALDTATACRIPMDQLPTLWALGGGQRLLTLIGLRERQANEHQAALARTGAEARIAAFLVGMGRRLERQGRAADRIPLPMSRTDLANHLGMTLECLSRVLARLGRAGVISTSRHEIVQQQPLRLRALAFGELRRVKPAASA